MEYEGNKFLIDSFIRNKYIVYSLCKLKLEKLKLNNLLPVIIIFIIFAGTPTTTFASSKSNDDEPRKEKYKYLLASAESDKPVVSNPPSRPAESKPNVDRRPVVLDENLASNFVANRGAMPWPVNNGYISAPYGKYTHPLESKVTLENSGVNITVKQGTEIRSVFQGTVCRIEKIAGTYTVIVNHGDYYSVYSYLSTLNVKKGDKVNSKHNLGVAGKNDEGMYMVHFEICRIDGGKNLVYENPNAWINNLSKN